MKKKTQLILLAVAFVLPVLIALAMQTPWFHYDPQATKNYGRVLSPSPQLGDWLPSAPGQTHAGWTVAYLADQPCAEDCSAALDLLGRVWAAQGQERDRVRLLYATPPDGTAPTLPAPWVAHPRPFTLEVPAEARVVLIDPEGFGATWYAADFDGTELRKDLRHLLKWSKSGR